ncbi:MAG: 4-alpha-glucanotransferase [Nitrospiraceae bacterium]
MSDGSERDPVDDLAERYGIAPEYYDIWGQRHVASGESKRAILRAMGLRVETVEDLRGELAACLDAPWRRACDPVMVQRTDVGPQSWSFRMPAEESDTQHVRISWEIRDEGGTLRQSGEAGPGLVPAEVRTIGGQRHVRFKLPVPLGLPDGYYDVTARGITPSQLVEGVLRLILTLGQCYVPTEISEGRRIWGLALQLYALRSARNWGIGDFGDLGGFVEWAVKDLGAGLVGVSPLHALKNTRPSYISPYSPDSRLYLNVIYLDVERIPEYAQSAAAQRLMGDSAVSSRLEALRKGEMVEYDHVDVLKRAVLEALFATFQERHLANPGEGRRASTERGLAFERFLREEGDLLETFAVFQALSEELRREYPGALAWQEWPERYRHPGSEAVAAFRKSHEKAVRFHQYLQWVAAEQLVEVAQRARALGMPIGLYHDLAVGCDRSGSEAWSFQNVLALEANCGAPPDPFAPAGQDWGLPPINPVSLRATGYRMVIALLRNNLRYGGALRLDHVMALFRLFWIPRGLPASAGTYVRYPAEDLLGILALESVRHHAMVVGEDLGTVPDEVRVSLAAARVLSYRVLYFERGHAGEWNSPGAYPAQAVAVVGTHDLPTLAGFWAAEDIEVRSRLGGYEDEDARLQALADRQRDKTALLAALRVEGLLPDGLPEDPAAERELTPELFLAVHAFLGRSTSWIVLASLEDVQGEMAQVNVPGTVDEHPNWSRKASVPLEALPENPRARRLAELMRTLRPLSFASPPQGAREGDRSQ